MLEKWGGRRVALRHRIAPDGTAGPRFSDAVGELELAGPDDVVVHTRSGAVRVARDAVVAAREVPPAAPRRASRAAVARLERLRCAAWPAPERRHLGGWLLRAAGGYSNRANSALVLDDPGRPLADALDEVVGFAAEHRIAPLVQAPTGSPWSNRIREAGWRVLGDPGECLVLVAPADVTGPRGSRTPELVGSPPDAWWGVFDEPVPPPGSAARSVVDPAHTGPGRGGEQSKEGVARAGEQSKGTDGPVPAVGFGLIGSVGAVRAAVVEDHVYVSRLHVRPEHRRRGHAGELMGAALAWGRDHGARHAVLDVTTANSAARALYVRDGWVEHHRYHYLAPPPR